MAEKKYVGTEAFIRLVAQLKAGFATLTHTHKLEDITDYTVDSALSGTSTNPVQNQALKSKFDSVESAIAGKAASSHAHDDRYYTEDEVDEKISGITSGTIIVKEAEHAESADTATSATTATTATNANHATTADSATSADSATTADSATKDGSGNVITSTYETKSDADVTEAALTELINGKANASHSHAISDVTNLQSTLNAKATQSSLDAHTGDEDVHITSAERTKLAGVAAGAQVNTITGVKGSSESSYRTGNVNITKANIGLGSVDNTSDANKPVSTAQQSAIDAAKSAANTYTDQKIANLLENSTEAVDSIYELRDAMETNADAIEALQSIASSKADASALTSHTGNKSNPHGVTAAQIGAYTKAEVDATVSDLEDAIDGKAAYSHTHTIANITNLQSTLDGKAAVSHGNHVPATQTANNAVFLRNDNTWATVTPANIGAATSGHTHNYAGSSSAGGAANSVANSIAIKLNGGTTEGTNLFTYNGSGAKTINITPASIGAQVAGNYATASHTHDDRYYTESEIDSKVSALNTAISGKAASSHTHSISDISGLEARLAAIEAMLISITDTEIDEICG